MLGRDHTRRGEHSLLRAGHPDERDGGRVGQDPIDHILERVRGVPEQVGGGDDENVAAGEHLALGEPALRPQQVLDERLDRLCGQVPGDATTGLLGDRAGEVLDGDPDRGQLGGPRGHQVLDRLMPLRGAAVARRVAPRPVGVEADVDEFPGDVLGPLGVQLHRRLRDPRDGPMPQPARRAVIGNDPVAQLDRDPR